MALRLIGPGYVPDRQAPCVMKKVAIGSGKQSGHAQYTTCVGCGNDRFRQHTQLVVKDERLTSRQIIQHKPTVVSSAGGVDTRQRQYRWSRQRWIA